ncbi:MAG: hypothetical protein F6K62_09760, partial [Sphaerospermopsis sp. SIO1G2]|nr:hypothetical protein [Sphaerospermopsis sp. SIO1G2]
LLKLITLIPVALLQKRSLITSTQLGLWLSQAGEFGFMLFSLAYTQSMLEGDIYQMLMVSIGVSFVLTPLMIALSDRIGQQASCEQVDDYDTKGKVLILGFGPEGKNVARLLHGAGIDYIGIDNDPMRVAMAKSQGFEVSLGNPGKSSLYRSIYAGEAKAAVFVLDHDKYLPIYISRMKQRFPHIAVFANILEEKSHEKVVLAEPAGIIYDKRQNGIGISKAVLEHLGQSKEQSMKLVEEIIFGAW